MHSSCSWSYGYKGTQLHFIDSHTVVYGCGNTLTFVNHSSGEHVRSLASEGRGVGPIAVCPRSGLVAYTEDKVQPEIFVLKYPACNLVETLSGEFCLLLLEVWHCSIYVDLVNLMHLHVHY